MNQEFINYIQQSVNYIFSSMVNQAIINQNNRVQPLPQDQQEALNKILSGIHDIFEGKAEIKPEYEAQIRDSVVLKIASEMGWHNGGNQ